jgi:hypothetical protein
MIPVPASIIAERRLNPGLRVLVIFPSLSGRVSQIPSWRSCRLHVSGEFQSQGGDVKPKMNYESEFIKEETRPEMARQTAK